MSVPLINKVDCLCLPVSDLAEALAFYSDRLGQELIWRTSTAVGLRLPDSAAELVLQIEGRPPEVDLVVNSVPEAIERFRAAGGRLLTGPFDIQIGKCAVVADPWGNELVLLDQSKGPLKTDLHGNVVSAGD